MEANGDDRSTGSCRERRGLSQTTPPPVKHVCREAQHGGISSVRTVVAAGDFFAQ